ncbi:MAG: rod shape-determining protein [Patescibacteria group bacterium]
MPLLRNILGRNLVKRISIDLGSANVLVYVAGQGIVINEPSVVAINNRNEQILAVGQDAKVMIGRTPPYITISKPLVDGVISDFEVTEKMIKHFIQKVNREGFAFMSRAMVLVGIPLDITEVERKAVEDAVIGAGAKDVFLIDEPMAAAIGAGLQVLEPQASMIVDIGGGTTDIAVISLGGIVTWKSLKLAGDKLNDVIIQYIREKYNLLLGEKTSEQIKIGIGSALPLDEKMQMTIRGRDLMSGLPKEITISDDEIRDAMLRPIKTIVENIKGTIEATPPELVADLYQRGMVITGGGALLRNIDKLIARETKIPVHMADDPLTTVVRGAGLVLEDFGTFGSLITGKGSA